jgi:hypothetical protein
VALAPGAHAVFLRNTHRENQSAYLANALVPDSPRLAVIAQRRDERQTALTIEYTVRPAIAIVKAAWVIVGVPLATVLLMRVTRRAPSSGSRRGW